MLELLVTIVVVAHGKKINHECHKLTSKATVPNCITNLLRAIRSAL